MQRAKVSEEALISARLPFHFESFTTWWCGASGTTGCIPDILIQEGYEIVEKLIVGLSRCGPADVQPNLFSDIFCFMSDNFDSIMQKLRQSGASGMAVVEDFEVLRRVVLTHHQLRRSRGALWGSTMSEPGNVDCASPSSQLELGSSQESQEDSDSSQEDPSLALATTHPSPHFPHTTVLYAHVLHLLKYTTACHTSKQPACPAQA